MDAKVNASLERLTRLSKAPLEEYRNFLTSELCQLTESTLSYFATIDAARTTLTMIGWSRSAMINCGMIGEKPLIYKMAETGLWGDAVRENGVVITNDYPNLVKATKKGYPAGHVNIRRHMNLPIREGGKIVLVVGVGNKRDPYTKEDARLVEELVTAVWPVLKSKI